MCYFRYKCGKGREFLDPETKETYDSRFDFILLYIVLEFLLYSIKNILK